MARSNSEYWRLHHREWPHHFVVLRADLPDAQRYALRLDVPCLCVPLKEVVLWGFKSLRDLETFKAHILADQGAKPLGTRSTMPNV